jgi:hypothetical protein
MDLGSLNWLAIVACVVISMVTGTLWYNPKTFFPIWWKGIGKTDKDVPGTSNMNVTWALTVFSSFVQAVAMALMVKAMGGMMGGGVSLVSGAGTGFMLWLGFVAPTYMVNKLFAGHGLKVWGIEVGNHLLNFVLFGALLGAWQ